MEPVVRSVHQVVDHILRCGSIDSRFVDSSAPWDGARVHRRIQKEMGERYQKEVSLSLQTELDGIPFILQGRADGIITEEDGSFTVDEIKSTTLPLPKLREQQQLHWGQAACYGHMFLCSMEHPPENITLQLTYVQLDSGETERHRKEWSRCELAEFVEDLLRRYSVWLRMEANWTDTRNRTIKEAQFPFPGYRRGQRELAVAVYRTISRGKNLYVQAPTGIGKTISVLFPSVKALGESRADKIFYFTAKTVTRAVAEESVSLMAERGLRLKSVTLRAKDKICPCDERICTPERCRYANGHYDRINDAILDLLDRHDRITPEEISAYSERHRVCPYELALDCALWADLVIGDYNHIFDPIVYLRRFFSDDKLDKRDYIFLFDEAHNLADRVRDMHTAELRKSSVARLLRALTGRDAASSQLRKTLRQIDRYMRDLRKEPSESGEQNIRFDEEPDTVLDALVEQLNTAAEEWLAADPTGAHPASAEMLEFYFSALFFRQIGERYDSRYRTVTEISGSEVVRTLYCLDPASAIAEGLARAKASVMFSATLTPLPYYRELLGGTEDDDMLALLSPFDPANLLLAAHCGISTKYRCRADSLAAISDLIRETVSRRAGNYLVFFPSYEYLRQVAEVFTAENPDVRVEIQDGAMDEDARARFLAQFDADNTETLVGFCVLGGIFSEGIDLKGDRLIGAIVVGVGLPRISPRLDQIRDYFDMKNGRGYDFAYVFPGMNKVLQAAGRVIRSETDRGIVLLIDDRFTSGRYRALFPAHWSQMNFLRETESLTRLLDGFYSPEITPQSPKDPASAAPQAAPR